MIDDVDGEYTTNGRQVRPCLPPLQPDQSSGNDKKRKRPGTEWTSLDRIVEEVTCPDEIYEALMTRAGKYASQTSRLRYLTRLFFHFAGPHAFEQVRDLFSAIYCTKEVDLITLGGRVRALERLVLARPVEKRALLVCLCSERSRLQTCAENEGEGYPDRAALNEMVNSAYPDLKSSSKEYASKKRGLQKTLDIGPAANAFGLSRWADSQRFARRGKQATSSRSCWAKPTLDTQLAKWTSKREIFIRDDDQARQVTLAMDDRIGHVLRLYDWAFLVGQPTGKLTAYLRHNAQRPA